MTSDTTNNEIEELDEAEDVEEPFVEPSDEKKEFAKIMPTCKAKKGMTAYKASLVAGKFKKKLADYTTEKEVINMIKKAKKIAKSDKLMLKFLLEHLFGKPRQNVGLDGGEGKPITIASILDRLEDPKRAYKDDDGIYKVE